MLWTEGLTALLTLLQCHETTGFQLGGEAAVSQAPRVVGGVQGLGRAVT